MRFVFADAGFQMSRAMYYLLLSELESVLPLSRRVVKTLTGDFLLTARANSRTRWLRRAPVARGLVRFLGLPI